MNSTGHPFLCQSLILKMACKLDFGNTIYSAKGGDSQIKNKMIHSNLLDNDSDSEIGLY